MYFDSSGLRGIPVRPNLVRPGRELGWTFRNQIEDWNATREALAEAGNQFIMIQKLIQANDAKRFRACYCTSTRALDTGFRKIKPIGSSQCTSEDQNGDGENDVTGLAINGCNCNYY
ncbi:hypothetical protein A10D4_13521 [Idiomarina xiamenensis 10-D-4]|uniref:Uncharacterized protein n=1 Tax=Idiomarina xiamenensis 10-D-4 TaxID=740709 RepID=K2J2M9_9GAMM|nr:hypothetical protein A10D4_13521 [Idiomarina xiamenensis 10-D-4]